jgi:hypothetical protein
LGRARRGPRKAPGAAGRGGCSMRGCSGPLVRGKYRAV